jgi:hypothetical protein
MNYLLNQAFTVVMKTDRIMWAVHTISISDSKRERKFWFFSPDDDVFHDMSKLQDGG